MIEFRTELDEQKIAIFDELCEYAGVSTKALLMQSPDPYYGATRLRGLLFDKMLDEDSESDWMPCGNLD